MWLATLALFLQVATPPGFMVGRTDGGPGIVICTGHGPLVIGSAGPTKPGKPPKTGDSGICVFAGHGAFFATPVIPVPIPARLVRFAGGAISPRDLVPGRGLAAPPPPSQGPPRLSI